MIAKSKKSEEQSSEIGAHNLAVAQRRLFVVKKHDATRLHYDLRLGHRGVLLSWAIPDGPSYWPGYPREAIEVEDHRRENAFFEGVIPEGYGAGTVMVWDWGTWEPRPGYTDVDASLRNGLLKFTLEGEKLKGNWILARVFRLGGSRRNPVWMLTKEEDSFARSESAMNILEEAPNSIATRKTLEEIADDWSRGRRKNKLQGKLFDE
jgi:bifunctional non-homologous end joining protein LigD